MWPRSLPLEDVWSPAELLLGVGTEARCRTPAHLQALAAEEPLAVFTPFLPALRQALQPVP